MTREVEETPLPGVGVRYAFTTSANQRVSVLHQRSGRHQVFVCPADDPERSERVLELDDDDAKVLAELLGTSRVVREIDHLKQSVAGLSIEWLTIPEAADAAGRTVGELEIRSTTGVTVVAALRGGEAMPVPGPDFVLRAADTVVVMGTPDDITRVTRLLRG